MNKLITFFLFFCLFFTNVYSQDNTRKSFVIKGLILNSSTLKPVPFAHIFNESRKYGFIADSSGNFISNMRIGDTLAIMALGYMGGRVVVSPPDTSFLKILIEPQSYKIEEVSVALPRTYNDFKEAFMKVDINKDRLFADELPQHNPYKTPVLLDTNYINSKSFGIFHPISARYYRNNKNEIAKRNVWELQQQELKQPAVDKKYNKELISRITGLEGHDVLNFMLWCSFDFNFLYESTPLEIVGVIERKFSQYKECCYEKNVPTEK